MHTACISLPSHANFTGKCRYMYILYSSHQTRRGDVQNTEAFPCHSLSRRWLRQRRVMTQHTSATQPHEDHQKTRMPKTTTTTTPKLSLYGTEIEPKTSWLWKDSTNPKTNKPFIYITLTESCSRSHLEATVTTSVVENLVQLQMKLNVKTHLSAKFQV